MHIRLWALLLAGFLIMGCETGTSDDDDDDAADDDDTGDDDDTAPAGPPQVEMETTLGTFVIELEDELAPITTENFLTYVNEGFYDGSDGEGACTFHRVISGFMVQGGGLTEDMTNKSTHDPIVNESDNGLSNLRGTLAMARTNDPDSATSQFFINTVDNEFLDIDGDYPPGYAVFGEVIEGMDVVDAIEAVPTGSSGGYSDVPVDPVIILSTTVL